MPKLPYWDKKFYYQIHCNRQRAEWNEPLSYYGFILRLWKWMNVHDAIYMPPGKKTRRWEHKPTVEDNTRRRLKLNEENVQILDFDEIDLVSEYLSFDDIERYKKDLHHITPKKMNKIQMPKPKKSLLQKLFWWIKKK